MKLAENLIAFTPGCFSSIVRGSLVFEILASLLSSQVCFFVARTHLLSALPDTQSPFSALTATASTWQISQHFRWASLTWLIVYFSLSELLMGLQIPHNDSPIFITSVKDRMTLLESKLQAHAHAVSLCSEGAHSCPSLYIPQRHLVIASVASVPLMVSQLPRTALCPAPPAATLYCVSS